MNTLLHFLLLLYQSCRSLRNVSLGSRFLGLIKNAYHGWLRMMTSSDGPFFRLASCPHNLNPPLCAVMCQHMCCGPRVQRKATIRWSKLEENFFNIWPDIMATILWIATKLSANCFPGFAARFATINAGVAKPEVVARTPWTPIFTIRILL